MVPLGRFNFKDDSIASIIELFHAQLERVLQSEKNETIKLDDNLQVKVKLLGISNMTHIRNKTEKTAFSVQASGQDATAMQLQCNCNATAMQLQCNCNTT